MKLLSLEPESSASANSATSAYSILSSTFYTARLPRRSLLLIPLYMHIFGRRAPRDSCGAQNLLSLSLQILTAAPFRPSLSLPPAALGRKLPIPPLLQIFNLSSIFTRRGYRGEAYFQLKLTFQLNPHANF